MGVLLLSQKDKKHLSISLLACLLILSGLTLLNDMLVISGISNRIKELYFVPIYYSLSIGPLFYLFVKSKFRYRLQRIDLIHLVIPLAQAIVYFSIGFRSVEFKSALYNESIFRLYLQAESFLFPVFLVVYTLFALLLLRRKSKASFFWKADLRRWLQKFSVGMLAIAGMEFCLSLMEYSSSVSLWTGFPFYLVHSLALSVFVIWIAVNGFKQYYPLEIFSTKPSSETPLIDDKELAQLVQKLRQIMSDEKVFLNPDLNLKLLANYIGVSEKRCSYVLNKGMQANFNQYINELRISAFKERIKEGQNKTYTLTSIAYECGFDSKSTFNRVFKSSCGMTPSEFVKTAKNT